VIQSGPALVEGLCADQVGEAMQSEQRVPDEIDDVPEGASILVEHRLDA
jgi:hypothetical protein